MRETKATIREGAVGPITYVLSTLYGNPDKSVMREYIANGLDAHIEAGIDRPVEVDLPSRENPNLVIRDFGTGLNRTGLEEVFFAYGESTKTNTNEQIGTFGLGAKSAYSITTTWTVTSIHEGLRYTAAMSLDENDIPVMRLISDGVPVKSDPYNPDADKSGVTVSIPIKLDHYRGEETWRELATALGRWFPKGLVDFGIDTAHWTNTSPRHGDIISDTGDSYGGRGDLRVLMGGILYEINHNARATIQRQVRDTLSATVSAHITARGHMPGDDPREEGSAANAENRFRSSLADMPAALTEWAMNRVVEVPVGSVNLLPSREELRANNTTVNAVVTAIVGSLTPVADKLAAFNEPKRTVLRTAMALVSTYKLDLTKTLTCAGIPIASKVSDYGVKEHYHNLSIPGIVNKCPERILVTEVPSDRLPYIRIFRNAAPYASGFKVFYTKNKSTGNAYLDADLATAFPTRGDHDEQTKANVLTYDEYCVLAKKYAAENREQRPPQDKNGGKMRVEIVGDKGHSTAHYRTEFIGIHEIADLVDKLDASVYLTENQVWVGGRERALAESLGFPAVVVWRGRRKEETVKQFIPDIAPVSELYKTLEAKAVDAVLSAVSAEDIRALRFFHSEDGRYGLMAAAEGLISAHPDLLQGSRVTKAWVTYARGRDLNTKLSDDKHPHILTLATGLSGSIVRGIITSLESNRLPEPDHPATADLWPLVPGSVRGSDPKTLRHLAMYLAMIG
jgi:hypothetical protein